MQINEFTLVNEEKLHRVLHGVEGTENKGLGDNPSDAAILAEYDKLGGLILGKENSKVKTGSFYDFKNKGAHKEPKVVYTFRINGRETEVADGELVPLEVKAAVKAEEEARQEAAQDEENEGKVKKPRKKK